MHASTSGACTRFAVSSKATSVSVPSGFSLITILIEPWAPG